MLHTGHPRIPSTDKWHSVKGVIQRTKKKHHDDKRFARVVMFTTISLLLLRRAFFCSGRLLAYNAS